MFKNQKANRMIQYLTVWIVTATFFLSSPILAQDLVIDSGAEETVISRLPAAPVQEAPVCSDTTDGTLGPCNSGTGGLSFYETERASFVVPIDGFSGSAEVSCNPGDTMLGLAEFGLLNLGLGVEDTSFRLSNYTII
ncbi:MAG: hypothetical protein AAGH65_11505, partial [Pseudomonadota bacterium]